MKSSYCATGGIMALISVIITLGIHAFLEGPNSFEDALQMYQTPYYIFTKFWVIVHCAVVLASMYALCRYLQQRGSVFSGLGFVFYAAFGLTEIVRMCLVVGYLAQLRSSYLESDDDNVRQMLKLQINGFAGVGQALFLPFFYASCSAT